VTASPAAARALTRRWWPLLGLVLALASVMLSSCTTYHGALTSLGSADQYPVGRWSPDPNANQVRVGNGIYLIPQHHLILVHILVPDTARTSLGPGAVHGAVGVWWVALDDRAPHADSAQAGALTWIPACVRFKTGGTGAAFDVAGSYLGGPAPSSLSRYPISINPEDDSISLALAPADEIALPRSDQPGAASAYLKPASMSCAANS
jgi:hypothetical protein